jgi:hypothetical protein
MIGKASRIALGVGLAAGGALFGVLTGLLLRDHTYQRPPGKAAGGTRQLGFVIGTVVLGVVAGWLLTVFGGDGRPVGAAIELAAYSPGEFGVVEAIRLPREARKLNQLKSFFISMEDKIDDFAEVFVNNYLAYRSEDKVFFRGEDDWLNAKFVRAARFNPTSKTASIRKYLQVGLNVVMIQLINSRLGDCEMTVSMSANGSVLEGFPRRYPDRADLHQFVSADHGQIETRRRLARRLRALAKGGSDYTEDLSDSTEAICSRRFFIFNLTEEERLSSTLLHWASGIRESQVKP